MQYIFRNTNENYTSLNNAFMQDKTLDPTTIGILAVILTNEEGWQVYPEEISKRLGISRRTINRHFQKLEDAGYLKTVKYNYGGSKGSRVYRFFSDIPISDECFEFLKSRLERQVLTTEK